MKINLLGRLWCAGSAGLVALLALTGTASAAAFTPGNLVVLRVGDGIAALGSAACAVYLDEYTTAGVYVQTIAMPTAPSGLNFPLSNSGSAVSEGFLNLSSNGQYLVNFGYGVAPGLAAIAGTTSAAANRVVGRVDMLGNIDTTTAFSDLSYSAGNPRSATSDNGTQFWTTGPATATAANGGFRYATLGATTSTQVSISVTNLRVVVISPSGTDMFVSSMSGTTVGVCSVTPPLPTVPGAVINILPGFPTSGTNSDYDIFPASATTIFVADDRSTGGGGIQRWDYDGTLLTWVLTYTQALTATVGCRGLTGTVSGGNVTLYATTHQTAANQIVTMTDNLAVPLPSPVTALATPAVAVPLTGFRGIRLLPGVVSTAFTTFCYGDGSDATCPCGLVGTAGRGCPNGSFPNGAALTSTGIASITADTLVLKGNNAIPFSAGLYFQGSSTALPGPTVFGLAYGHGLVCMGGQTPRLEIVNPHDVNGASQTVGIIHNEGGISLPGTYNYQWWYRDNVTVGTCSVPAQAFNFSNGLTLTWIP